MACQYAFRASHVALTDAGQTPLERAGERIHRAPNEVFPALRTRAAAAELQRHFDRATARAS